METSEVLVKALEILEEKGWCKRELQNIKGEYCLMGAINKAAYGYGDYPSNASLRTNNTTTNYDEAFPAVKQLAKFVPKLVDRHINNIVSFNNNPKTTIADIKKVMCSAIKDSLEESDNDRTNQASD